MGTGYLKIETHTGDDALPVSGAYVTVLTKQQELLYELVSDESGNTDTVTLEAPDRQHTMDPDDPGPHYAVYDVHIGYVDGFMPVTIENVQVYDGETTILPVSMGPMFDPMQQSYMEEETIVIPPNSLEIADPYQQEGPVIQPVVLRDVIIPSYITVHLGRPDQNAENLRVRFTDYIKNVTSHEIYSTWPAAALEANMYCHITFALNRIYTEWYRSRGYDFDITNSTAFDQYYVKNGGYTANIGALCDRIFNYYARRQNRKEPYFTQYCNGTTSTCNGLSQWGSMRLAEQGYTPINILRNYYPSDLEVVPCENFADLTESYPGTPLRQGDEGRDVLTMQLYLNRIRLNYPLIPRITSPEGVFDAATAQAVRTFQQIFDLSPDGVIGKSTWYKISYLYVSVKKLAELEGEGEWLSIGDTPPNVVLREGAKGDNVLLLQYMLNFIGAFYPTIPSVSQDGAYGSGTKNAVTQFQRQFGLTADGTVGPTTWNKLYEIYWRIENSINIPQEPGGEYPEGPIYPGVSLKNGSRGNSVLLMQQYLSALSAKYPSIPAITPDGVFGNNTERAVRAFQTLFGLTADGIIGQNTWNYIVREYNRLDEGETQPGGGTPGTEEPGPVYPGSVLRPGAQSSSVLLMQQYLNSIATRYPSIPRLVEDGKYGTSTANSVTQFQTLFGLNPDGLIGPVTWNKIVEVYQDGGAATVTPAYPGVALRVGSRGNNVLTMQRYLNGIRSQYPTIPQLSEDGIYGAGTENAVRIFQQLSGLGVDGVIGANTWRAIVLAYNTQNQRTPRVYSANRSVSPMAQTVGTILMRRLFLH